MEKLSPDLFINQIKYLTFADVISLCQVNRKFHTYCTDPGYSTRWKVLVKNKYGNVLEFEEKLKRIWKKLGLERDTYNYLVYTNLVKTLDPITQLMIYYRQGDMESFDSNKYNNTHRFLTMFLLKNRYGTVKYLPSKAYQPFIDMLDGKKIDKNILDNMMIEMAKEGHLNGVKYLVEKGADIHAKNDLALELASREGHLEVVKYLQSVVAQ